MSATDLIDWSTPCPKHSGRKIPLLRAPVEGSISLAVLSPKLVALNTHFIGGRTVPCTSGSGACACLADDAVPTRWVGYLAGLEPTYGRIYLAEITVEAVEHCALQITGDANLRGLILRMSRLRPGKRSPVRIALAPATYDVRTLPPEPDVRTALLRMWGAPNRLRRTSAADKSAGPGGSES